MSNPIPTPNFETYSMEIPVVAAASHLDVVKVK